MMRMPLVLICLLAVLGSTAHSPAASEQVEKVIAKLNDTRSVKGTAARKSYHVLFDAYLELDPPPFEIGASFNHNTIHPGMPEWSAVSSWAESNPGMAEAIMKAGSLTLFGLPYGEENVEQRFREASLVAQIGIEDSLRNNRFPYLDAIEVIAAYTTAESYRRLEAHNFKQAFDLAMAHVFTVRQGADREFVDEQIYHILLLTDMLANLRDMFYKYIDEIPGDLFTDIGRDTLPFLRPDHRGLFMPEGDRVVAEALLEEVFAENDQPDPERFAEAFAEIQARDQPLTRFGAARRWRLIAQVHDSRQSSLDRLTKIYDDWWRRWRVQEYDPILSIPTQFDQTNEVRYAAVVFSMQNIQDLFSARNVLMAAVNGTVMTAGICGYKVTFGAWPRDPEMTYQMFAPKRSDKDPFEVDFSPLKYRIVEERTAIDTPVGRLFLPRGEAVLYSRGQDLQDDRAAQHSEDGDLGSDIVFWPAIKAMLREEGLIQ